MAGELLAARLIRSRSKDLAERTTMTTYRFVRAADALCEAAHDSISSGDVAKLAQAIEEYRTVRLLMRGTKLMSRRA